MLPSLLRRILRVTLNLITCPHLLLAQTHSVKPFDRQFPVLRRVEQFEYYTTEQGLSHERVHAITQDANGFMWFGTENGLNRWDGYTMKVYKPNPHDSTALSSRDIGNLFTDSRGRLWIATTGGLDLYDHTRDAFIHFRLAEKTPGVNCIGEDRRGEIWIGTQNGLDRFDEMQNRFIHYKHSPTDSSTISNDCVNDIQRDRSGHLWICTLGGVDRYDEKRDCFVRFFTPPATRQAHSLFEDSRENLWIAEVDRDVWCFDKSRRHVKRYRIGDWTHAIAEDMRGRIWLGTHGAGLWIFDPHTQRLSRFTDEEPRAVSLNNERVNRIYRDNADGMWLGTERGVRYYDARSTKFHLYEMRDAVQAVCEDNKGFIWFGTNDGLYRLDRSTNAISNYHHTGSNSIGGNNVRALFEDKDLNLWIGGDRGVAVGFLDCFDKTRTTFTHYITPDPVKSIRVDRDGELWVGLLFGGEDSVHDDLLRYDKKRNLVARYNLPANGIWTIHEDRAGKLWFGSMYVGGVNVFDKKANAFTYIAADKRDPSMLNEAGVRTISEDTEGMFWIGTWGEGFCCYDPLTQRAQRFTEADGLQSDFVKGILPDDHGNLWISTENGIASFTPSTRRFTNYTPRNGLQDAKFGSNSCWRGRDGWMWFGGEKGLNAFHPDSIKDNPHVPRVYIMSVKVFDNELPLSQSYAVMREIEISYDQNHFTFEFAALSYADPKRNQYAYMMEGEDAAWIQAGTRRYASYTNLAPGTYTFRVKGSNNDGIWNEEGASITIIITPPWWRTTWAYLGYALIAGFVFYSARRYDLNRVRLKHQAELEHVEAEKLREVDHLKSQFFANISHEFRTPLTLILGPIQKWQERCHSESPFIGTKNPDAEQGLDSSLRPDLKSNRDSVQHDNDELNIDLSLMERNAQRLLRLINQLLDLSKLEVGGMKLQAAPGNIVPFVKGVAQSFKSSAGRRGVALTVEAEADEIEVYFDRDKLEKILVNLLSNAFKFTSEGGAVALTLTPVPSPGGRGVSEGRGEGVVAISVRDTGIGIPADELPNIFDRFYQVHASQTREEEGSGIGLALTKELVELHHGTINVTSEVGNGTTFVVTLPLGKEYLTPEEIGGELPIPKPQIINLEPQTLDLEPSRESESKIQQQESLGFSPLVLIIEDNADVRAYIGSHLTPTYRVEGANDGVEGISKATELIPDLIISDIMMPKIDGNEVCRRLKTDERTSHIPIILLTAKAGRENKLEGLETGADDYLTKPFDAKELLIRIKNLIELRRKLREKFHIGKVLKPGEIAVTSMDDQFLQKAMPIVEKKMGDEKFSVEEFANDIGMSRSQLHRKLTALTNQSPSDFIRYMRLHRAKELLVPCQLISPKNQERT